MVAFRLVLVLTATGFLVTSGCSVFNKSRGWGDGPPSQSEPAFEEDKWSSVGKEGRGNRPLEDEHDPLKPFLMSPQARQIERNLGYK